MSDYLKILLIFIFCGLLQMPKINAANNAPEIMCEELLHDMSAYINPVMDLNDIPCALVRVNLKGEGATFSGNIIGEVSYSNNVYNVYMTAGTKTIRITHQKFKPILIEFAKYDINFLNSKHVYEITILYDEINDFTNKADGSSGTHQYVDLGLPSGVKWATCNVGASAYNAPGGYFAWGECEERDNYNKSNSIIYNKTGAELLKNNIVDESGTLTDKYDVASVVWGREWRTPTMVDWLELINECRWTWSNQNGMNGCIVTGSNGHSIFLPAAGSIGYTSDNDIESFGEYGHYWSASRKWYYNGNFHDGDGYAGHVSCGVVSKNTTGNFIYEGNTVRPVLK